MKKLYTLIGLNGDSYQSQMPGQYGGHSKLKIFGKLNCPSALWHLERGHYKKYRVFFADAISALKAGYRPCAKCLPSAYAVWKKGQQK